MKQRLSLKAACVIVVCPLKGIVQDQLTEASSMGLMATSLASARLKTSNTNQLIFASAEEILAKPFLSSLKKSNSPLQQNLAAIIVDESHTVETWTGQRFDFFSYVLFQGKHHIFCINFHVCLFIIKLTKSYLFNL